MNNETSATSAPEPDGSQSKLMETEDPSLLLKAIAEAQAEVSRKEDILRQLKIVKAHCKKNQEEPIDDLIDQWRAAAQQAILDLQQHMPEPRPGLKDILSNFHIEPSVIGYCEEDDCFV